MKPPATPVTTPAKVDQTRVTPPRQEKPFPDFPLFWHARGYWCVKRQGRQVPYSADWKESYDRFLKDEEARRRGDDSSISSSMRYTIRHAANLFLQRQGRKMDDGEISPTQFAKYRFELLGDRDHAGRLEDAVSLNTRLLDLIGMKGPEIFARIRETAMVRGVSACERHVICVRAMLDYVHRTLRLPAPNYGDCFDKPNAARLRKAREARAHKYGERAWSVEELRQIVAAAAKRKTINLYAWILLGLNVGYQAIDVAGLPESDINHEHKLLKFPRAKNGKRRISPLWVETYDAICRCLKERPEPASPDYAKRVFLLPTGLPPTRTIAHHDEANYVKRVTRIDTINLTFKRMVQGLGLAKYGAGFNTLRAMFRTLATGASADPDLVAVIMGRATSRPVDEFYLRGDLRSKVFDVADHVKRQLWPGGYVPAFKPPRKGRGRSSRSRGAAAGTSDSTEGRKRPSARRRARTDPGTSRARSD